jgi:hypothetical protein
MRRRSGSTSAHVLSSGSVAGGPLVTPFRIQKGTRVGRSIGLTIGGVIALSLLVATGVELASGFTPEIAWQLGCTLLATVAIAYALIEMPMWIEFGDRLTFGDFFNVHVEDWPDVKLGFLPGTSDDGEPSLSVHQLAIFLPNGVTFDLAVYEGRQILQHFDAALEHGVHDGEQAPECLVNLREWLVTLRECLLKIDPPGDADHGVAPTLAAI